MNRKHGMTGKRNAAKDAAEQKSGNVQFRCVMADKNGWVKTAQTEGMTLSAWIIDTLNKAKKS
jgi:hypothetical protein